MAINYELFITCTFLQLAKVRMARVKKNAKNMSWFFSCHLWPRKTSPKSRGATQVLLRPPEAWAEGFDPFGEEQKKQVTQLGPGSRGTINVNLVAQEPNVAQFCVNAIN